MIKTLLILFSLFSFHIFSQEKIPDWAKGTVWYQIFPERFCNGDTSNDPTADKVFKESPKILDGWKITPWTSNWFAEADWEKKQKGSFRSHLFDRRYGGDLQGIIDKLNYLQKLGVKSIFLNPIFDAVSLHKYDASTYNHVDVNFGPDPAGDEKLISQEIPDDPSTWVWTKADKLFLKLIQEVHNRGMHIIIDGVFNHTGVQFWAFQDIVKNKKKSKYKDWYQIKSFDDPSTKQDEFDYKGWWGNKSLPQFNRTSNDLFPGPKQYIFYITKRWMDPNDDGNPEDGIDGWRLDAANEVPMRFWHDWSKLVKGINPNAIIIGELWNLSPDFISDSGAFDASMNYNFAKTVNKYFIAEKKRMKTSEFISALKKIDSTYPEQNLDVLQNLVDSHDTDRLSSMIKNPDRDYDSGNNEGNKTYNPGKPSAKDYNIQELIAAFQMTYRGAPMIYYGDEVGMWGADDPHDRKPMIWDSLKYDDEIITKRSGFSKGFGDYKVEVNHNLENFYKKVIAIHNNNFALQKGDLEFLYSNDKIPSFAFKRSYDNKQIISAFNLSDKKTEFNLVLNNRKYYYTELLSDKSGNISGDEKNAFLKIELQPKSVKIYKLYILN